MRQITPLCELADKYETDKGGLSTRYGGGDGDTAHNYTPAYYDMFKDRVDDVKMVLEIGVNAGGSLRMWEEFFPNARIYGLDIRPEVLFASPRIGCLLADQGSPASLRAAMAQIGTDPKFDLIIDDGSHEFEHQRVSMLTLLPYLSDTGYYVVEDLSDDCHPELLGNLVPPEYEWTAVKCYDGIGKAHCWCPECSATGPEQLLIIRRK